MILLVPGLALLGRLDADPRRGWGDGLLGGELDRLVHSSERRSRGLMLGILVLFVVSVVGMARLEIETDFTKNFRRGSPIVDILCLHRTQSGRCRRVGRDDPGPRGDSTRPIVDRVRDFRTRCGPSRSATTTGRQIVGLTKVLSLIDGIEAAGINPLLERIPPELKARGMAATMPNFVKALRTESPGTGQAATTCGSCCGRANSSRPPRKSQLITAVTAVGRRAFSEPPAMRQPAQVTGFYVLLTNLITSVLRDQWICFAVATLGVGIMMCGRFPQSRPGVGGPGAQRLADFRRARRHGMAGLESEYGRGDDRRGVDGLERGQLDPLHHVVSARAPRRA